MSRKGERDVSHCRWGRAHTWTPSLIEGGVTVERRCARCGLYKHLTVIDVPAETPRAGDPILAWRPGRRP